MPTNVKTKKLVITASYCNQRLDNFLFNYFKNVPKSRIYKGIRKGEVRVNGKRIAPLYKLQLQDELRIPPFFMAEQPKKPMAPTSLMDFLDTQVIYEDKDLIILNKPSGLAVHGGSGIATGIIETLKQRHPTEIELVHRLDRETSGCLLIAKKRSVLKRLHQLLIKHKVKKTYLALLKGQLTQSEYTVDLPLAKRPGGAERMVMVNHDGKSALTIFRPIRHFQHATLVEVELHTGRMHQIRVHASSIGHPVAGDTKYGDQAFNLQMRAFGLKRLFLHAAALEFHLSPDHNSMNLCACLEEALLECLRKLEIPAQKNGHCLP